MNNFLFLGCTSDGVEYYLRKSELRDGKVFFCMYSGDVVYDVDTSLRTKIEDDMLLADLEDTYGTILTNEYINNKRDLLIRHYFHRIPGLDDHLFWDTPKYELSYRICQDEKLRLMSKIQDICGIRTDDDGDEWTDFSDEYVSYDDVCDFIDDAFKEPKTEKVVERDVVYKHI